MKLTQKDLPSVEPSKHPLHVDASSPVYALCDGLSLQVTSKGWKRGVTFTLHDRLTGERSECTIELPEVKPTAFFSLPKKVVTLPETPKVLETKPKFNLPKKVVTLPETPKVLETKPKFNLPESKPKFKFNLPPPPLSEEA